MIRTYLSVYVLFIQSSYGHCFSFLYSDSEDFQIFRSRMFCFELRMKYISYVNDYILCVLRMLV